MSHDFEVVSPIGDARDAGRKEAKSFGALPLGDLNGKKIGLVWTEFYNGDTVLRAFREHLGKRYSDLEFIELAPGRDLRWGDHPTASIADLARENGIDAAVVAAGC
jgi:hypothetical protein